jgi:hypothetical protein
MKSSIFWDVTPCSPLKANLRFGGKYRLHLQDSNNKPRKKPGLSRYQAEKASIDYQRTIWGYIPEERTVEFCTVEI